MRALAGPMPRLVREIRAERYDTAIDLQGLTKSAVWARICGATKRIGFEGKDAREFSRHFYNCQVDPPADRPHVVQRNLSLLQPLGIRDPEIEFPLPIAADAIQRAKAIWGAADSGAAPKVIVNPGAGWETKRWPRESYGELARSLVRDLHARVAFAWGPGEEHLIQGAIKVEDIKLHLREGRSADGGAIPAAPGVYALPSTNFMELAGVIAQADLFIAGDTGPTHLAAALGVPTLGIYGASDPIRNGPLGPHCQVLQADSPSCIPCWKTRCDYGVHLACLRNIEVEEVLEKAGQMLGGG